MLYQEGAMQKIGSAQLQLASVKSPGTGATSNLSRTSPIPRVGPEPSRTSRSSTTLATISAGILLLIMGLLPGCSDQAAKPAESVKEEPKGPELVTGRSGFQKIYIAARGWAPDPQPFRIESTPTSDGNGHDGKWAVWRTGFASPSRRSVKTYVWSGSAAPDAPSRGVSAGTEDTYNPNNSSTTTFDVAFLKVDSDQAFTTAQKHGGDKVLAKSPDTPVNYVCDWNRNTNELVWHVIYGANRESVKLNVAVNASSGEFIRVEK
jgi:hypothetical protein